METAEGSFVPAYSESLLNKCVLDIRTSFFKVYCINHFSILVAKYHYKIHLWTKQFIWCLQFHMVCIHDHHGRNMATSIQVYHWGRSWEITYQYTNRKQREQIFWNLKTQNQWYSSSTKVISPIIPKQSILGLNIHILKLYRGHLIQTTIFI